MLLSGASVLGPLISFPFCSIFSGIPLIKKTSLLGVEKDWLDLKLISFLHSFSSSICTNCFSSIRLKFCWNFFAK